MKKNVVKDKSYSFAIEIVELNKELVKQNEFVLSKQLLRSGTAIGALIRESEHAESKKDFIHKLSIALKEANESIYWINLLQDTNYIDRNSDLEKRCEELIRLLVSIIKSSKNNL